MGDEMRRVVPFLVVFAAGIALGYFLADQRAPLPVLATDLESTNNEVDVVDQPAQAQAQATSPAPLLHGRPTETTPDPKETTASAAPRVAPDGRVEVVVKVLRPDGSTPSAGRVLWSTDPDAALRSMRRMSWSPPQTSAFIQPGDVWLLATGGKRESLRSKRVQVQVSAEKPRQELLLVLEERAGIHGKVVLPAAFDRPRLTVRLLRYEGDTPPEKPDFDRSASSVRPSARDGYGFVFHDLRPGGYLLGLSLGRRDAVVVKDVQVQGAMVERDLGLEAFDPKQFMEVTVLGPNGQPMRDAQLSISFSGEKGSISGGNVSLLRDDGTFIVDHVPSHTTRDDGTYKEGVFSISVRTREHGEIVKPYDPASTRSLTIRLGELQELAIQLVGYSAATTPRHLMVGVRAVGETGSRNARTIGSNGSVHFGERPPGAYEVVFLAGHPRPALVAVHPIEFAPGDSVKEVPSPVFHRLVLRLPKSAVEPEFSLSRRFGKKQWSYGRAKDSESGEMVFEHLTEGTYTLTGHYGTRWVKREVRLPAESEVRLD